MKIGRRIAVAVVLMAQLLLMMPRAQVVPHYVTAAGSTPVCPATPGNWTQGGTLGLSNTYWVPPAGTLAGGIANPTITLGAPDTGGGGNSTPALPAAGDELLIIQMQDGTFNSSNSSSYGDGTGIGSGYTSLGNAGLYEYVSVASVSGSTLTLQGAGTNGALLNSYYENTAANQRYQVVRVPQYITATLSGNFKAAYWDGQTGGVAAIDVASTLNLGGSTIYAAGDGFRGAGVSVSGTSPNTVRNNDYRDSSTMNGTNPPAFGGKGEGVLGTPNYLFYYTNFSTPSTPSSPTVTHGTADGYSGGDQGMGAPGNAGGGGTDDDPQSNDQNTGGGGGGNGGAGGKGGFPWTPNYSGNTSLYSNLGLWAASGYSASNSGDLGGRGGSTVTASVGRAYMGGGGGAGSNNNGSNNNSVNNYGSSGGVGGGVVLMRLASTSGAAATIYADGTTGLAPANDGGGGGGAGGTVIITSPNAFTGITVHADGAAGTTANASGAFPGQQHGPGGGGGGGIVLSSSSVSATVLGGTYGTTTPSVVAYGATSGLSGYSATVTNSQVPGIASGAVCGYNSGSSGTMTIDTGPYDSGDASGHNGAGYTGSYDGVVTPTNNNDFTAREIPFAGSPSMTNSSTNVWSPTGNTFTATPSSSVNIENSLYYSDTAKNANHILTLTAAVPAAPAGWTATICADNSGSPSCTPAATYTKCVNGSGAAAANSWMNYGSATATYCYGSGNSGGSGQPQTVPYWVEYTGPNGTYTAFNRYDGYVTASDDNSPANTNVTHHELYAGIVAVSKSSSVVTNGCPANVNPPSGTCPGGVIKYAVQYANIVAGGGLGTEGQVTSLFPGTQSNSLHISDDGSAGTNNWATYTAGLVNALSNSVMSGAPNCGVYSGGSWGTCGDTLAGTTCTYTGGAGGVGATAFNCTIGGGSLQLYPAGITGQTSTGTMYFAVKAH